ncbi:MAG: hypothetical protein ACK5G7_04935 [Erysipelotrichaceae bacterium]
MELLFFVLNKLDCLDDLLKGFSDNKISGATVIDSTGLAHLLAENDYGFGMLRTLLDLSRSQNKTIFMVCEKSEVKNIEKIIEESVGNLNEPNTGVLFTVPVSYVKGIIKESV